MSLSMGAHYKGDSSLKPFRHSCIEMTRNDICYKCLLHRRGSNDSGSFLYCFLSFLMRLDSDQVQMELETIGQDQIISPGTLAWAPHHPRPQVTSVICAEGHHRLTHPCQGRALWARWAGDGSITSC